MWRYIPFHWQKRKGSEPCPKKKKKKKKIPLETFQPILDKDWEGCHQLMARRRKIWIRRLLTKRNYVRYFPLNYRFSTRESFKPVAFKCFSL